MFPEEQSIREAVDNRYVVRDQGDTDVLLIQANDTWRITNSSAGNCFPI